MSTYQIVPYIISVKPRSQQGAETRPLADLDGEGTKLVDLIAATLATSKAANGIYSFPKKTSQNFRVELVSQSSTTIYFIITQGVKGIESKINDSGNILFERQAKHVEDVEFRNLLIFPGGGKYAIWLTERIGNRGVSGFVRKLISDTLRQNFHEVTTDVAALTTAADLSNAAIGLRSIEFKFPKSGDASARFLDLAQADGFFSLKWRFGRERKLSNFTDSEGYGIDATKVFGTLNPGLTAAGFGPSGATLKELGVTADLNVTLPSGHHRTFTLGIEEGPGLAYSIDGSGEGEGTVNGGADADLRKPTNDNFLAACRVAVSDVSGNFGVTSTTVDLCQLPDAGQKVTIPPNWKAVWNVPDLLATDSP